jgi:hypothetical protein
MEGGEVPAWFWLFFPFLFVGMWLAISSILALLSGWFALQSRFPDRDEPALRVLRGQSGSMGIGVGMSGILKLSATRSGLRVQMNRMFGPFLHAFLVPWDRIRAEPTRMFFAPSVRLRFGDPQEGVLTIAARSWERLAAHSAGAGAAAVIAPVPRSRNAWAFLLQWVALTVAFGAFFYIAPRLHGLEGPPLFIIVFPGLAFGVAQLIRYFREG